MKLLCMRHGQTNYNIAALCNDDPAREVALTATGRQQAEEAAQRLRDTDIERIFVSELPRTRQTAEIVNRHHGVAIVTHSALNDIRSGFDGQPVAMYQQAIAHDPLHASANDGESLLEHGQRVVGFIEWLRTQPDRTVLVVAHEETMRAFAVYLRELPAQALVELAFANCEIVAFDLLPTN
ncbi:MAG: histidine phosphatase family protein [Pseudomonadota bacterium]|nr:MAG: histidine phosphatase family protein [Pseudomonadota bacterium]